MAESRIEELRRRLARDPGSRLFAQLAEELRKDGELEEAVRVAREGLEKHPAYPSARLTLGRALLDSGDPAAARAELEEAVRGAPDNILASRLLGEALETLGDLGAALLQYRATLQLAPGDRHVEARIRAIQARLGAGQSSAGTADSPEPGAAAGQEAGSEGELPPTIRIRMPGDAPAGPRAPLPPPLSGRRETGAVFAEAPAGVPGGKKPLPPTERLPPPPEAAPGDVTAPATPSPDLGGPGPGRRDGGGMPTGSSTEPAPRPPAPTERIPPPPEPPPAPGEDAAAGETSTREAEEPVEAPSSPPGEGGDAPTVMAQDSDLAPTLPRSRAAEYAVLGEGDALPPTLPPGVITGVEEEPGERLSVEEPRHVEPGPVEEGEGESPLPAGAEEDRAAAEASLDTDAEWTGVDREGVIAPPSGDAEKNPNAVVEGGATARHAPLSSATLAELYFQQGLLERAVEVYRQVLEEEPGNERARSRLGEIGALVEASAAELPRPPEGVEVDPAVRRRALERAIDRLEALLAVVQRR